MRWAFIIFLSLCASFAQAQKKTATVSGIVLNENDLPLPKVSITILGRQSGIVTSDSGTFRMAVPAEKAFALIFSHASYTNTQRNFYLSPNENDSIIVKLSKNAKTLEEVVVTDERLRKETGLITVNPKTSITLPSTIGGVEGMIKTLVGSNNELSSQYSVRGGNYDENLVYINDFEVYRPYLVSSGQQEGLSMINSEMARNVNFYTGGFQAKYGDKMSSVLDIQYKKPTAFRGSVYAGLLEQGMAIEGSAAKKRATYLIAARNRNNSNLLKSQPTQGAYIPGASDVQALFTYSLNAKTQIELLGIGSFNRFTFYPESVQKTAAVFSPLYAASLGLDIYFSGREKDNYQTSLLGLSLIQNVSKKLKLKWMLNRFTDKEKENVDIGADYLFGDRDFAQGSSTFGQIINPLGAGYYLIYARNELKINSYNAGHKGSLANGKHFIQWGQNAEFTQIKDALHQFEYRDSAGYSLPYNSANIYNAVHSNSNLDVQKFYGYLQDNIALQAKNMNISLQAGLRYHYNSLNKEFLISPRMQASFVPKGKKDIVYKLAAGLYHQPPFYREVRNASGSINADIKAQKSMQFVAGFDYNFKGFNGRPLRLTAEGYYKRMWDVIPYDVDNVKITYLGNNDAKAYATGVELRLFGELVKDAESWVSIGFMRTRENLANDYYYQYKNAAGEIIGFNTLDKVVVDSVKANVEWLRRPSDRLITFAMYLEDYLTTNKNLKVHLNLVYGTNMPYNIAGSMRYRNGLEIPPYMRADLGFSALLLSERSLRRSHSPFRSFENIWLSAEVFNIIDRANTISFQMVKDFSNTNYAIPNRLTPRLVNIKLLARF